MAKDKLTNHFVANVPIMGKPVSYFALEKCKKIPKKTVLGGRGGGGGGGQEWNIGLNWIKHQNGVTLYQKFK